MKEKQQRKWWNRFEGNGLHFHSTHDFGRRTKSTVPFCRVYKDSIVLLTKTQPVAQLLQKKIMQLEDTGTVGGDKQEIAPVETVVAVEEEDDDDEEDGPPPGFQRIITPPTAENGEAADSEEDDGPPPGFDCIAPKPLPSLPSSASSDLTSSKQDDMDDDEDGPPPGWEFSKLVNALPIETSNTPDIKEEGDEELDEGPPPGWESVLPCQMPQPQTPPLQPQSTVSSNIEIGSKEITPKDENETPHSESEHTPMTGQSSPATPPPQQLPASEQPPDSVCAPHIDAENKDEDGKNEDTRPTSGQQLVSPLQQLPPNPQPLASVPKLSSFEKAQLVCGTCRKLCVYPRGTKWIRCPGCQEVNFVLEAHEVGQVKCGGCTLLLMYPHGAPAVQCSSCRFVTEIGAHNRRPPLSVQQAQARDRRRQRCSNRAR